MEAMHFYKTVFFFCVMICSNIVALADKVRSEEVVGDPEIQAGFEASVEAGPPDSHEAMNNRNISPKIRQKRSYEFLMGLINNNSRYEVIKVDPSAVTVKPKVETETMEASELLLQLMTRIAEHPDQWNKVHRLLESIDRDLRTSRIILRNLTSNHSDGSNNINNGIPVHKKEFSKDTNHSASFKVDQAEEITNRRDNGKNAHAKHTKWPIFDSEDQESNILVNNSTVKKFDNKNRDIQNYTWQVQNRATKSTYPKNFSYHRVTGKPIYLNKNPKAYIAVSVIAPKQININPKEDDVTLETELHQLRPWTNTRNSANLVRPRSWLQIKEKNSK